VPNRGYLIAIDGIDGAGKTTQCAKLVDLLRSWHLTVIALKEPTSGVWGQKIRESAAKGRLDLRDEYELFMNDRKQNVAEVMNPALEAGSVLVIDRYYYSTAAYQGARGGDIDEILQENERFAPRPNLLVIMDIDPIKGLSRIRARGDTPNLFEQPVQLSGAASIFRGIQGDFIMHVDAAQKPDAISELINLRLLADPNFRSLLGLRREQQETAKA
jgi:dTMP kinase